MCDVFVAITSCVIGDCKIKQKSFILIHTEISERNKRVDSHGS